MPTKKTKQTPAKYQPEWTMAKIQAANAKAGRFFFQPEAMRFFNSHIESEAIHGANGVYFVTSERFVPSRGEPGPRLYSVRRFHPSTGDVETVGVPFETLDEAHSNACRLAIG